MDNSHATKIRVIYGDTDMMGFAYHANYLRWFEIGRTDLFRSMGMSYKEIEDRGYMLPLSEAHCKFVTPARYDDVLLIEAVIDSHVRGGMKFDYLIYREEGRKLLASGYTRHAFIDRDGKVVRPPAFIRELVETYLKMQNEQID